MKHLAWICTFALCLTCIGVMSFGYARAAANAPKREKVIDFEDEVVEGMNKRPLDSLSQLAEKNKRRRKPHLYRKRVGFRSETLQTLREMGFTQ